jgi:hypothetical protein
LNYLFKERISRLTEDQLRTIVNEMVVRHPGYVFDILDSQNTTPNGGHHPPEGSTSPEWCTCSYCRDMPSEAERHCCGRNPENCYSQIAVCINFYIFFLQ